MYLVSAGRVYSKSAAPCYSIRFARVSAVGMHSSAAMYPVSSQCLEMRVC